MGVGLVFTARNVVEIVERYDNQCEINEECEIKFDIDDDMPAPIFVYYEIQNFY